MADEIKEVWVCKWALSEGVVRRAVRSITKAPVWEPSMTRPIVFILNNFPTVGLSCVAGWWVWIAITNGAFHHG